MNLEMILNILGAWVVLSCAALRLNLLKAERRTVTFWSICEVLGLAGVMGGCAGVIGEWFMPTAEFHAETVVMDSVALFAFGISKASFCQVVARLQGWDGADRRKTPRGVS